ncbi:hypothetical protein AMELA_G00035480 [Ameiurus melas]|uniref:Uncharacterized protein n=1 Tax=Ameiurus melas TaxID=219545 RepID=A0A7J6B8Q3_AMEME|nr:hypothetical protein AMELA_G00035480 [Ameiurus melas]
MQSIHKLCFAEDVVHENTLTKKRTSSLKTAKVEHLPALLAPALPPVPRKVRRLMPAQQERLESIMAHHPDINTPWVSRRVTNINAPNTRPATVLRIAPDISAFLCTDSSKEHFKKQISSKCKNK